ncbi:MAG: M1 family aminopeptidase [Acidobacteria bacterium]|nr:M1 family aminopeptidase [Acidobacteriota bacterium]
MNVTQARGVETEPDAGIPRELARWRAAHYGKVRYDLAVTLASGAEMLKGVVKISAMLDADAGDLVLDWRVMKKDVEPQSRVSQIKANGKPVSDARFVNDHIVIPRAYLVAGENVLQLSFESPISASGSAVTRYLDREDKSEYVYTLFVPSDASTTFPCFDQPDLKARFILTLTAPDLWRVISNTAVEENGILPGTPEQSTLKRRWQFQETQPLSTYQFAFAAGPFAEFKDDASAYGTHLFVRKSKAERAKKELAEVFRLNRDALKFYERYFDYKFPFPKYDLVLVPEFAYGGMEHAGATFLREESILFPTDPTAADLLARADVMAHEAAHQWFGDLVTMRWFDDLWLKEGFATFMGYKAIESTMPQFDAWKVFHLRNKPLAYLTDATKGTTPIFQEIPNLSAAKSAYGNIVYRKAPSILRQAEFYLGQREFQRAIQLFVKEHAYANATWDDLVRAFERTSGRKLGAWADAWVKRRGMADVRVNWTADRRGRINRFTVEQRDVLGEGGAWPLRVKILLASDTTNAPPATLTVTLDGAGATAVREALGKRRPAYVFANFEDYGYGRFLLDDKSRAAVLKNLGSIKDDFLRALLWGTLWDSVREAELAPTDFIELGIENAARERDDVTLQFILARVQTAFTRYLSNAQKASLAPRLEGMIFDRMLNAETPGLRITYFRTYREIATTSEARGQLVKLLAGDIKVPGMTLRSRDRFDIIRALTAAGDERAPALLKQQGEADKTDDGRRYAYAAAAAAPDPLVKRKYFDAYLHDAQLAESWIEASFGPFNTPQQAELTRSYLEPSLRELPTLKRTRKIFFINGWLAAFIGGQCDERAVRQVQQFLAQQPSLDRDLRLKVLEAADGLERCVRISRKYKAQDSKLTN